VCKRIQHFSIARQATSESVEILAKAAIILERFEREKGQVEVVAYSTTFGTESKNRLNFMH